MWIGEWVTSLRFCINFLIPLYSLVQVKQVINQKDSLKKPAESFIEFTKMPTTIFTTRPRQKTHVCSCRPYNHKDQNINFVLNVYTARIVVLCLFSICGLEVLSYRYFRIIWRDWLLFYKQYGIIKSLHTCSDVNNTILGSAAIPFVFTIGKNLYRATKTL